MAGASWPDPSRDRSPTRTILESGDAVAVVMGTMVLDAGGRSQGHPVGT
jgi:hypothetical protein